MTVQIGWPQTVILIYLFLCAIFAVAYHGKAYKTSAFIRIPVLLLFLLVLYWGGFFA